MDSSFLSEFEVYCAVRKLSICDARIGSCADDARPNEVQPKLQHHRRVR